MQKLLVIDDENELRATVIAALSRHRYKVIGASSWTEGLEAAKREKPDLVLCDLNMTDMGGASSIRLLRQQPELLDVPFIVMTGDQIDEHPDYPTLNKPFTLNQLLTTVRRQLKTPPDPAAPSEALPDSKRSKNGRSGFDSGIVRPGQYNPLRSQSTTPTVEQLEQLLARVQFLRESERSSIARAIHDDLSQKLTVLAIELSLAEQQVHASLRPELTKAGVNVAKWSSLLNDIIRSAQEITAQLRPKVLDEFGFIAALEWLVNDLQRRRGIQSVINLHGEETNLSPEVAASMFRLSQEILTSIAAPQSKVGIELEELRKTLQMQVTVQNPREAAPNENIASLDLLAMQKRVENLGGRFDVETGVNQSLRITISVPVRP